MRRAQVSQSTMATKLIVVDDSLGVGATSSADTRFGRQHHPRFASEPELRLGLGSCRRFPARTIEYLQAVLRAEAALILATLHGVEPRLLRIGACAGLKRLRKAWKFVQNCEKRPSAAKAGFFVALTARLKSCLSNLCWQQSFPLSVKPGYFYALRHPSTLLRAGY